MTHDELMEFRRTASAMSEEALERIVTEQRFLCARALLGGKREEAQEAHDIALEAAFALRQLLTASERDGRHGEGNHHA